MDFIAIKLSVTTCYLVRNGVQYLLVDTGYVADWDLFCAGLKKAGVKLSQISHLLLTHHHDDHCGLLPELLRENPAIRVILSRPCKELIAKGENDLTHGGGLLNKRVAFLIKHKQTYVSLVLGKKIDKESNLKFPPYFVRACDILVDDNTALRDIGLAIDGTILTTPGHTVDAISLLFPDGDCLVGDAAASMLAFAGTKNCVIFICDMAEYYRSWQKLLDAGAKRLYPAHGKPFSAQKLRANMGKNKAENLVLN